MTDLNVPYNTRAASARGAPPGEAIPVPQIDADDALLAVVAHDRAEAGYVAGLDVSEFSVSDGEVVAAGLDTDGRYLRVLWTDQGP